MKHFTWVLVAAAASLVAVGCGDDSGGTGDSGPADSAADTTTPPPDTSVPDTSTPPPDSSVADAEPDAAVPTGCDPYTADSCGAEEKCSVAIAFDDAGDVSAITFECVPAGRDKGRAAPCSLSRDVTPDDETDNIVTDDCQQGLFCFTSETASARVCRPLCDNDVAPCGDDQFCLGLNDEPFFGVCETADGCDPVFQTGCSGEDACYVIGASNGDLLGTCFAPSPAEGTTGAAGETCMFINSCQAGLGCLPEIDGDGGAVGDSVCRPYCDVDPGSAPDGGVADGAAGDAAAGDAAAGDAAAGDAAVTDAGTPPVFTGECPAADVCRAIEPGEGATVQTPTTPGVCQ